MRRDRKDCLLGHRDFVERMIAHTDLADILFENKDRWDIPAAHTDPKDRLIEHRGLVEWAVAHRDLGDILVEYRDRTDRAVRRDFVLVVEHRDPGVVSDNWDRTRMAAGLVVLSWDNSGPFVVDRKDCWKRWRGEVDPAPHAAEPLLGTDRYSSRLDNWDQCLAGASSHNTVLCLGLDPVETVPGSQSLDQWACRYWDQPAGRTPCQIDLRNCPWKTLGFLFADRSFSFSSFWV